jgi:hypothetical protein
MLNLVLLPDGQGGALDKLYTRALANAVELFIVSAYLTEWNPPVHLSGKCKTFRLIVGKDFGITRKQACRDVMRWLPARLKNRFMVAEEIDGFHPKAMFWKEVDGSVHAVVGSSNLTRAAFSTNHEANVYLRLSVARFNQARDWVRSMERWSIAVSEDWLDRYREAPKRGPGGPKEKTASQELRASLQLPRPRGSAEIVRQRRAQLVSYRRHESGLMNLFKRCARGQLTNSQFYAQLPRYWSAESGDRLQGAGWERQGKASSFREVSRSFLAINGASDAERDDVVAQEIDRLHALNVASRTSFLSEMLCLRFPKLYPVKNKPVSDFLSDIRFKGPRGASEGAAYVDLAQRLRMAVRANKGHPAKNVAELDAVIWLAYGRK